MKKRGGLVCESQKQSGAEGTIKKEKLIAMADPNLKSYIHKVLKQDAPDHGISAMTSTMVEKINHVIIQALMKRVNLLTAYGERKTITSREIQTATQMLFPGELRKKLISRATYAVAKYDASLNNSARGEEAQSQQSRAGLTFPVKRLEGTIRALSTAPRVGLGAPVYLAAVLEEVTRSLLKESVERAKADRKVRITPKHIREEITNPTGDFSVLMEGVMLSGVVVHSQ